MTTPRRYRLFTRHPRRPGVPVAVFVDVPEADRAAAAREAGVLSVFTQVMDIEAAEADVRDATGAPTFAPDATLAAYRLLRAEAQAPLGRRRFLTREGEVHVQGEFFRPAADAQIWREAIPPALLPLELPDLGEALGPLLGIARTDVIAAYLALPPAEASVAVVLLTSLAALRQVRPAAPAATWFRLHPGVPPGPMRWAFHSAEASTPLFDGQVRLFDERGAPMPPDGTVAAAALVAQWRRSPRQMAFNAELGDGATVVGQIGIWVEGPADAPDRLSIAAHVLEEAQEPAGAAAGQAGGG